MSGADGLTAPFEAFTLTTLDKAARTRIGLQEKRSQYQEKRRDEALSRQQRARLDATALARQLASRETTTTPREDSQQSEQAAVPGKEDTAFFAKQLMQPEWMIDVPHNLASSWYVMPRPEGGRCLVIASWGSTVSRQRNGRVQHSFTSWLPGGSQHTLSGTDAFCILDCVFHEPDSTYYILDMMCWKAYALYDCTAEFRLYWRDTKLAEAADSAALQRPGKYRFAPVSAYAANEDGLREAHSGPVPYVRDGCLFFHREGRYDTDGPTPLALLWKDPVCSRYFVDTGADGDLQPYQQITLQCGANRQVVTGDEPPVPVGRLPDGQDELRLGRLVRFSVREGGLSFRDGEFLAADLHFEGLANQRRGRADLYSKIVFQHLARTEPIKLSHFMAAGGGIEHCETELDGGEAGMAS